MPISADRKILKDNCPSIVIGTPGRMLALSTKQDKPLDLSKVKYFVLDECDQMLKAIDMRRDVQAIFMETPHDKQVMMFSSPYPKTSALFAKSLCKTRWRFTWTTKRS